MGRRLTVLLLAGALLIPATAAAQSPEPDDREEVMAFVAITSESDVGTLLQQGGASPTDRAAIRQSIATQRAALLEVDPSECWIAFYLDYWDSLTLIDAAMQVFDVDVAASTSLLSMSTEMIQGLDPEVLFACI